MKTRGLAAYTNGAYTDLLQAQGEDLLLSALLVTNSGAATNALARIVNSDGVTVVAVIMNAQSIEQNGSYKLDLAGVGLSGGDRLQVQGAAAGLNFYITATKAG
jgi:hypothetical protein